jgi:hypothetical protein
LAVILGKKRFFQKTVEIVTNKDGSQTRFTCVDINDPSVSDEQRQICLEHSRLMDEGVGVVGFQLPRPKILDEIYSKH